MILRPRTREDLDLSAKFYNNQIMRVLCDDNPFPASHEEMIKEFERIQKQQDIIDLSIVNKKNNELIGRMNLKEINFKDGTAKTATFIFDKKNWGRGYGTEVRMMLLNYAFNTLNLRKIHIVTYEFNKRSLALSKKLGFQEEGKLKKQIFEDNKYWDKLLLGLFKEDWLPIWKKYKKEHDIQPNRLEK